MLKRNHSSDYSHIGLLSYPDVEETGERSADLRRLEGGLRIQGYMRESYTNKPLVSVVTIVLNGEKHIKDTIESVINQTYENIEYIIIDGGSSDSTINIIKQYEDKIDYWLSEKDNGISDAFNKGILLTRGEFIGIINSGDWYEKDAVGIAVGNLLHNNTEIVVGAIQYWKDTERDYVFYSNLRFLEKEMTVNHQTVFTKKSVYDKYGLFSTDFDYAMDYELLLRLKLKGASFHIVNEVLANMRLGGKSDKHWIKAYKEVNEIKTSLLGNKFKNFLYLLYSIIRRWSATMLKKIGFSSIVDYYKRQFSVVKKIKK